MIKSAYLFSCGSVFIPLGRIRSQKPFFLNFLAVFAPLKWDKSLSILTAVSYNSCLHYILH